ncbi:MAG: pyruvyl transferase [Boseongicola sp.]|nr:pyruvyl transferase [Silicimonas sp.]NNF90637.1 pyruvyl transferase [Boseongicola sp.]
MKLTYFRHDPPNFGDEINTRIWPHLLPPGFLDDDESELFLGAGSILWGHLPKAPMKIVAGSGYGGYSGPPDMHDGSFRVIWVRGPLTATRLGLAPNLAIADAAVLLRNTPLPEPAPGIGVAFMPHFESVARGDWEAACRLAGVTFLDPTADTGTILAQIRGARLVISEAMHGAIVADALRTPWIGIRPIHAVHRMKWDDWSLALDVTLSLETAFPSNLLEAYTLATGFRGRGRRSTRLLRSSAAAPVNRVFREIAARRLRRLAERGTPQMSSDAAITQATERCMEALHGFVRTRIAA